MDRIKKTRIGLIILGLFVASIGTYFTLLPHFYSLDFHLLISLVTMGGLGIAWYGFRYPERGKRKNIKVENPTTTTTTTTTRNVNDAVARTGLVIFFVGLAGAFVGKFANSLLIVGISFLFIFVGIVVVIIGRDLRNFEKNKKYAMQKN